MGKPGYSILMGCFALLMASPLQCWSFGKNKLIVKSFPWKSTVSGAFNIYYYGESGEKLLPYVETYLHGAYRRVTGVLPLPATPQIPFFLYNNHNDFEQTNITAVGEGTGGVTEAFKNRFLVAHLGSQRYLEYVLAHEFMHEAEFEYLFGGFWRSLRLVKFIFYPLWLMEGCAEYGSGDLDKTTREMYLRDAATTRMLLPLGQLHAFNHVLPHQVTLAYKESEAFVTYLAQEYGAETFPRLFRSFQERMDANSVLMDVYGVRLSVLDKRFREYLQDVYDRHSHHLSEPQHYGQPLTAVGPYPRFCESAVFSPDKKTVAYISDERGEKEIYLMQIEEKKVTRVVSSTRFTALENIHADGIGLSFSPNGKYIIFAGEEKQRDALYIYDVAEGGLTKIPVPTETAASPCFSKDGARIYFSGILKGFRNLFEYDRDTGACVQLTEGAMDSIDAELSADGSFLVFSQERKNAEGRTEYDLCRLELETKEIAFITGLPGDERYPCISPDGTEIYFTSDRDGILDIYRFRVSEGTIERLTEVIGGNFQPRISTDGKKLLFSSFRKGQKLVYLADVASLKTLERLPPLMTVQVHETRGHEPSGVFRNERTDTERKPRSPVSTDLFFPAVFYSSIDGLYLAAYWQASDFFGDHQLQSMVQFASGYEYIDYNVAYGFLRYRPQFYLIARGEEYFEYYRAADNTVLEKKKKENMQALSTVYPLNRFQRLEFLLGSIQREEYWEQISFARLSTREHIGGIGFVHDVVQGPYLEATSGWRMRVATEFSERVLGGDYSYHTLVVETQDYIPLGKEHVAGWRIFSGGSFGQDAGLFRLSGEERVRGLARDDGYEGHKIFLNTLEWRFPLIYNLNYHLGFMFPDFFFKTVYGAFFVDTGVTWNKDVELQHITINAWKGSYGIGLRSHAFVLETYPVLLHVQYARRMDTRQDAVYFSLGASF